MPERAALKRVVASRWFDLGLAIVLTSACLVEFFARPDLSHSPRAAVVVLLTGALLSVRRSHPAPAACAAGAIVAANPDLDDNFLPALAFVIPVILSYSCGAHAPRGRGLLGVAVLAAGMQIGAGFTEFPNFEIYFSTFGPWWVGFQLQRRRLLVAELAQRTAQLETEQDAFTRLAVRRERARIARELHDIVAHHLAVIVIQAGAGRLAPTDEVDRARERFAGIRESGGEALAEMARLVDILEVDSGAGAAGLRRLRGLLDELKAGDVQVHFVPLPAGVRLPARVEESAYRVVQEGLTNSIKHAPGSAVTVRLELCDEELQVEVLDSGGRAPSALATTGSGFGLAGMRERIESVGGRLDAGPDTGGGWSLRAWLPLATRPLTPAR
jgi:signal transduction histidine kinase